MKSNIKNLAFTVLCFLIALAEIVILYSFPVILYKSTQNLLYAGLLLALKPLMELLANKLLKSTKSKLNTYSLFLLAFSLFFIVVILFNKVTNFLVLPVVLILFGIGICLYEVAKISFMEDKMKEENSIDVFKVNNIVNIFAYILGPIFAINMILNNDYYGIFNYFAILVAVAGITFYFFLRKSQKQVFDLSIELKEEQKIFKDVLFIEGTKAGLLFIVPLYIITYYASNTAIIYSIPAFYLSSLIIKIIFKVFKIRFRQMNPLFTVLLLSLGMIIFFFSRDFNFFILACGILGLIIAVIENGSVYQTRLKEESHNQYYSKIIASGIGIVVMSLLSFSYPVNISIAAVGVIIIVIDLVITLVLLFRQKRKKAIQ